MYRQAINSTNDIRQVINIYNAVTCRNRTVEQHLWEWFGSPYKNKSYLIVAGKNKVVGHHGLLTVLFDYKGKRYRVGKTENTVMKRGFGAMYPKTEMAMHAEYSPCYDFLLTTAARGVTKRIREKLGYCFFANYINYVCVVDFDFVLDSVSSLFLKKIIKLLLPIGDLFTGEKKTNSRFSEEIVSLDENSVKKIVRLYSSVKDKNGFMQAREVDFLRYRLLDNPYIKFNVLFLSKEGRIVGLLVYSVNKDKLIVDDVLFTEALFLQEMLNRLVNYAKEKSSIRLVVFTTLENSLLDLEFKYFWRRKPKKEASVVMIKDQIKNGNKNRLKVDDCYFTRLTNEGIS